MRTCKRCGQEKPLVEFYKRDKESHRWECKVCANKANAERVTRWRRTTKQRLVQVHGGKCVDCGYMGPPFMFEFDHRDPEEKEFMIGNNGLIVSYARLLEESWKCDLVCPTCHRMRTHIQRCRGCEYCNDVR